MLRNLFYVLRIGRSVTYFRVVKYGATVVAVLFTFCVTIVGFIGRSAGDNGNSSLVRIDDVGWKEGMNRVRVSVCRETIRQ